MPRAEPRFEMVAGHRLPLGGINGYLNVRGKQGKKKDMFQGISPRKHTRTGLKKTALEAAIAFAQLREDQELGLVAQPPAKKPEVAGDSGASKKAPRLTYLGDLLQQQRSVIPTVACVLLSREQAAAAVARGVAVAFADVVG